MYITALSSFLMYFYFTWKGSLIPSRHIKSYIWDTTDFLYKCQRKIHPNTEILTFDATSLYTCIPHEYALKASGYFVKTFKEKWIPNLIASLF